MKQKRSTLAIVALAAALTACDDVFTDPGDPPITEGNTFSWAGVITPGDRLEIKGINGCVRAVATSGAEAEVVGIKKGQHHPPSEVSVQVVEHAGGVTICARYPDTNGNLSPCTPGEDWNVNLRASDVSVDFTVKLPDGVVLVARTVNGSLVGENLRSDAFLHTVNGYVEVSTDRVAEATAVNGSISATIGRTDWGRDLRFITVNGSIALAMPSAADTRVWGSTVNGGVSTDFPLTINESGPVRTMRGTLGDGTWRLDLTTVNGNIALGRRD